MKVVLPQVMPQEVSSSATDLVLNDPKGFEDRLMLRVKDALRSMLD